MAARAAQRSILERGPSRWKSHIGSSGTARIPAMHDNGNQGLGGIPLCGDKGARLALFRLQHFSPLHGLCAFRRQLARHLRLLSTQLKIPEICLYLDVLYNFELNFRVLEFLIQVSRRAGLLPGGHTAHRIRKYFTPVLSTQLTPRVTVTQYFTCIQLYHSRPL